MTNRPPAALDTLWEAIPTSLAPVDDLVARGQAVRRRRAVVRLGAAMAAVVAVVVAGLALRPHGGPEQVVAPPAGMRYFGIGRVAVAVPAGWGDLYPVCESPGYEKVHYQWGLTCSLGVFPPSTGDAAVRQNSPVMRQPGVARQVAGHDVVDSAPQCVTQWDPATCNQWFGVPDLHAYFWVMVLKGPGALATVRAIRDSLTVLPQSQRAVPVLTPFATLADWRSALAQAGFDVRVEHVGADTRAPCPQGARCGSNVRGTTPSAGRVVPAGSTVTIDVKD